MGCEMNNPLPTIVRSHINSITLEICHGEIPDVCRLLRFDPITEPKLPDTKITDEEFQDWLSLYRRANLFRGQQLLEESQCN